MREIKFRAWDVTENKMVRPAVEFQQLLRQISDRNDNSIGGDLIRRHELEWMQFIGISDRNGTDIYEKDILQVAGNQIYEVTFIFELQYGEKTCGWGIKNPRIDHAWIIDEWAIENGQVIGNAYENPGLLEVQ